MVLETVGMINPLESKQLGDLYDHINEHENLHETDGHGLDLGFPVIWHQLGVSYPTRSGCKAKSI